MSNILTSSKFNTISLQISFNQIINKEEITMRSLLPSVLYAGSKIYPTQTLVNKKLDELYGANLSVGSTKSGNISRMTFTIKFLNPKIVGDDDYNIKKVYDLLKNIIFNPKISDGFFDEKTVENEKNTLLLDISRQKENKGYYSVKSSLNELYKGTISAIDSDGYIEDLKDINKENLYEYYKECMVKDEVKVYIVGEVIKEDVSFIDISSDINLSKDYFQKEFARDYRTEVIETDDVNQCVLVMLYDNKTFIDSKDYVDQIVFDYILGGSPSSLLFSVVREKEGLCYSVSSSYIPSHGITLINAGISCEDYQKCLQLVKEQVNYLKENLLDENIIKDAIGSIKNRYLSSEDSQSTHLRRLVIKELFDLGLKQEEYFDRLDNVTSSSIMNMAKKLEFKLSYFLRGEEVEEN